MTTGSTKTTSSNTFGPRPSTGVPPANLTFEPLAKSVLTHRLLYNIFAYSAAFSLASTILLSGGDDANVILRIFRPGSWLNAALTWLVGVLPVVVVRKVFLTPVPEPASSPSKTLADALAKPTTRRWIAVYVASSLLLLSLEFGRMWSKSDDLPLSMFVKSRKHPYYLNGRLIFLVLAQMWLAISFSVRDLMLDRFAFRWAKAPLTSSAPFLPRNLATLLSTVTLFTFSSFLLYNVAFGLARLVLLPLLLRVPLLRYLLKPFIGHFVQGSWTLTLPLRHLTLESHAFTLGFCMLANWEFAKSLFDVYIPQPIKVANTADPNVTLVSGITSSSPLYLHFAYAELRDDVLESRPASIARRTALFSDQKFSPSLWSTLARESLLRLGGDYQTFLRRGAPPLAVVATSTAVPSKTTRLPSTPLLRKAIYKMRQPSPIAKVLDSFASDSHLTKGTDAIASETLQDAPIPELFRSMSAAPAAPEPALTTTTTTTPQSDIISAYISRAKKQCLALMDEHLPPWCRRTIAQWDMWWRRDRINKLAEKSLPNRDLDALIVQVLAGLVCASLTEDRYGAVQRDMPRILEAFLSFLTALEEYQLEVTELYVPPTPDEAAQGNAEILAEKERTRVEVAKATEAIGVVADALKSGVADVARTFGDKLMAFKFPPRTAKKLQSFVDYT